MTAIMKIELDTNLTQINIINSYSKDGVTIKNTLYQNSIIVSPEQIQEAPADIRSDLYSVGATYFACVTGKSPFPGSGIDVLWAHCVKAVPDPCHPAPAANRLRRAPGARPRSGRDA